MTDNQPAPNYHAVLVGVNWNNRLPLKGAVQDVQEVHSHLQNAIPSTRFYTFTATSSTDPDSPGPTEEKMHCPTISNVLGALQAIINSGQRGHSVYIHFSCHGTVIENPAGLGLVLLDDKMNERCLRGSFLAAYINQMVTKGLVVTLILDCCFSANIHRGQHVRYLSYDPSIPVEPPLDDQTSATRALRDADVMEEFMIQHPDGYAFIVAAGPDQEAKEVKYEVAGVERHHGRLTRHLMDLLKDGEGMKRSTQEVYSRVCFEFRRNRLTQHPILYGNERQPFFGGDVTRAVEERYHPSYYEVNRKDGNVMSIQAGRVHGISLDHQFTLYPSSTNGPGPLLGPIVARVSHAGEFNSALEPIDTASDELGNRSWKAIIRSQSALHEFPIKLSSSVPDHEEWEAEIIQRSLRVATVSKDRDFFLLVGLEDDEFIFRDKNGHRFPNIPALNKLHINIPEMSNLLEHLVRFNLVKTLNNPSTSSEFENSFRAYINVGQTEYDTSIPIPIAHLSKAELVVHNEGPHDLYVSVYDLSPQYGVINFSSEAFAKMSSKTGPGYPKKVSKKITMMIPEAMLESGHTSCEDVLKVIVTSHPAWMYNLQLPKLSKFPFLKDRPSRNHSPGDVTEEWSVRNFRLQTIVP